MTIGLVSLTFLVEILVGLLTNQGVYNKLLSRQNKALALYTYIVGRKHRDIT